MVCGLLILFSRLALPAMAAPRAIDVGGTITADTTWVAADTPHVVTTTVVIIGGTLTIEPGVVVSFTNGTSLIVQAGGRLVADGTSAQPIQFTSNLGTCYWQGVQLYSDYNVIRHSSLEYARYAIKPEVGSDFNTIEFNTFRNNGGCTSDPLSGAVVGSTDHSDIADNVFIDNNTAIYLSKSSSNSIARNVISGTDEVALSLYPSAGTRSSSNTIISNTVHHAGEFGIYVTVGTDNSILENEVYDNQAGGIGLEDQNGTSVVRSNNVYDNVGPGVSITDTQAIDLDQNLIWYNSQGVLWDLNNGSSGHNIERNVVCRDTDYLIRNNDSVTVVAEGNWWGNNDPAPGTEIVGTVDITPRIQLALTPTDSSIVADGVSNTTLNVTFNDGTGRTVPLPARDISVTTSAGTLSASTVTVDSGGQASLTLTSDTTPGVAVVTATDACGYSVTNTVTFAGYVDLQVSKTASPPPYSPGSTITYTISYRNNGNAPASGVVLTETIPASTTVVGPPGWTQVGSTNQYTWLVGDVPAMSGPQMVSLVVRIDDSLPAGDVSFTNVVQIGDDGTAGPDFNPADNIFTLTVTGGNLPDLWV
jgi:uncharacterized repeat protein (TIGR01451 family)